ncbi:O-antigen ligase family protein [Mycobacterium sp. SA01]|uniref:O-antigen ligase family protein n=1 Tax=Mycobacterium sp. SA01 TaxID=3238820 RepID=UPI00351BE9E9
MNTSQPVVQQQVQPDQSANSAVPNWLLIALPTAAALSNIQLRIALLAVVVIGAAAIVIAYRAADRVRLTLASLILPVGGLAIALRPNLPETQTAAFYYALVCGVMALVVSQSHSRTSAVVSLVDGLGLLLVTAVALRSAGIGGTANAPVVMDNFLTGGERVFFPLAGALTSGPTLAAAYLVAAVLIIRRTDKFRMYRVVAAVAAIYVLVQGDRRSALFTAILLLVLATFAPRILRRLAPWAIGILLTSPFILTFTGDVTQQLNLWQRLQRVGEQNSQALNIRLQVWSRSIDFYQYGVDWFHKTFGFGTSGQYVSGASTTYRRFFSGLPGSASKSPHNSVLQALFDGGWIAALAFLMTVAWLAVVIARRNSEVDVASLSMLTLLASVGSTEALLAPGYVQPVWFTLVALGMIGFASDSPATLSPGTPTPDGAREPNRKARAVTPRI